MLNCLLPDYFYIGLANKHFKTMKNLKKISRTKLKQVNGGGPFKPDTGIGTDPTGPACGGSHCPTAEYQCCYHPTGNYCVTTHCDD